MSASLAETSHFNRMTIHRQTLRRHAASDPLQPMPDSGSLCGNLQEMTKGEWIIQLIKIALGAAIALYFVWWSLEVLHRLPPH
jgi:hypothetical protein